MTELPNGWRQIALADLGTWYGGGTPSKGRPDYWMDGTVPWLSPKDMGPEVIRSTQDRITDAAVAGSAVRRVPAGAVALVVRSGILERTLPIAVVPVDVTLNQDMKALVPRSDIDARWVAWGLRGREQALLRTCRKAGTTVASLETKRLLAETLAVPPLAEQQRIVAILEDHLSRLDAGTDGLSSARRRLRMLVAAGAERAKVVAEVSTRLCKLSTLAVDAGYGTSTKCVVGGRGPAVVRIPNLVGGMVDLTDEKRVEDASVDVSSATLNPGDLLVVRTNGSRQLIGRTAVVQPGVDAAFASYLIRYRLDLTRVRPQWVHLMMRAPSTREVLESMAASSAGQYNLSLGKLDSLRLPVPPLENQDALLSADSALGEAAERAASDVETATTRGAALRQSLLAAAFSGRLT